MALVAVLAALPALADVNRIVLRVNDRISTLYEYEQRRDEQIQAIQRAENLSPQRRQQLLANIGESTLRDLFEEMLLLSRADQLAIRAEPQAIDEAVRQSRESFGIETDEEFLAALESSGMTLELFRQQMEKNIRIREVMGREVNTRIELEEEDLRRYYRAHEEEFQSSDRRQLREIVILEGEGRTDEDLAALAAEITTELTGSDAPWEETVAPYAEAGRATQPIDLGWVMRGDLDPELEAAVWDLAPGQIGEPVAARGGLHLVEVVDRQDAATKSFAEVQEQIAMQERERRFQEEYSEYMEELIAASYIVTQPPPDAAGFRQPASAGTGEAWEAFLAPPSADESEPEAEEAAPEPSGDGS